MPIKPKRISFTPHTPDADGICLAQQTAGAGSLTLNGADVKTVAGALVASFGNVAHYREVGYQVGIASAGNLSAVNFTVTGTDAEGKALAETLAGPNANTVETAGYFRTVSSVTVNGAVASDVTVGTVDEFATKPIPVDIYANNTSVAVDVSGVIVLSVQKCFERPTAGETPNWKDTGLVDIAADADTQITQPFGALRAVASSFTGGATVAMNILQAHYN